MAPTTCYVILNYHPSRKLFDHSEMMHCSQQANTNATEQPSLSPPNEHPSLY